MDLAIQFPLGMPGRNENTRIGNEGFMQGVPERTITNRSAIAARTSFADRFVCCLVMY
jgi:hypothetical protein